MIGARTHNIHVLEPATDGAAAAFSFHASYNTLRYGKDATSSPPLTEAGLQSVPNGPGS